MTDLRVSQGPLEVLYAPDITVKVSQAALELVIRGMSGADTTQTWLQVSQAVVEVLVPFEQEPVVEPGTSFGPLIWAEFSAPDATTHVWAPVDLPDPSTYYHGFKSAKILGFGPVVRALSDENGDYESQRFEVVLSDIDRTIRGWLGTEATRLLVNKLLVMRMISDTGRRALERPRTVAIGLVRSYRLH